MEIKRHVKKTCPECDMNGYRTDFFGLDHYGVDTKATRDCANYIRPCKHHECYVAMENRKARNNG